MIRHDLFDIYEPRDDWEFPEDEVPDASQYVKGPAREHLVKKVRTGMLLKIATLIHQQNDKDARSYEILRKAQLLQKKEYRKPKNPNRVGRPPVDPGIYDKYSLESDKEEVREYRELPSYFTTYEVRIDDSNRRRVSVPGL